MSSAIFRQLDTLRVWRREGEEAPHKPLLLLYALGHWHQGRRGAIPFREVDVELTALLERFGPERSSHVPQEPFWRLCGDGLWELEGAEGLGTGTAPPPKSVLMERNVSGRLSAALRADLERDAGLAVVYSEWLLMRYFPPDIRAALREAVGLPPSPA
jgi:putative restriction endonuclease